MSSYAVIIPTYNRAHCLYRAVLSAQLQSLPPNEIVVVDDGSTDETHEIMSKICRSDGRVRILNTGSRQGACYARNFGVKSTCSKYIAFLDSDDTWDKRKLERQIFSLDSYPYASGSGTWYTKTTSKSKTFEYRPSSTIFINDMLYYNVFGPTSAIVMLRKIFDDIGGFDTNMPSCQDWDLASRMLARGPLIVEQSFLTNQYIGSADRISVDTDKVLLGHRMILEKIRSTAQVGGVFYDDWEKRSSAALVDLMLRKGEYKSAFRESFKSPSMRVGFRWVLASMRLGRKAYH